MCKCKKSKEIVDKATKESRVLTEDEAIEALAADLDMDEDKLREWLNT